MTEETREVGFREGVTHFVERKDRTVYEDGSVVDEPVTRVREGTLAEFKPGPRLAAARIDSAVRKRDMVDTVSRTYRQVTVEAGPWTDLGAEDAPDSVQDLYVAQVPITAGSLLYTRPVRVGEDTIVHSRSAAKIWPLTQEASEQGHQPIGLADRDYYGGDLVRPEPIGSVAPPPGEQPKVPTIADLLTWEDLEALRRAGEIAVANAAVGDPEDLNIADDALLGALRQALGRLELGRTHGYEAKP